MKPEESVDFHIRWVWAGISRMYNAEAAKWDGTMSIGYALLNIDLEEGILSTQLGPRMGMEPTSLTRTLKKMEEEKLIERIGDPDDKRKVRLFLTDKGKEMRKISRDTVIDFNEHVRERISETHLQNFFEVMNNINKVIEHKAIKNNHE